MQITCPHCNYRRDVDPAKVPDRPVKVTCPQCQQGFSFDKTAAAAEPAHLTCPACGLVQEPDESCRGCGVIFARWQQRQQEQAAAGPAAEAAAAPEPDVDIDRLRRGAISPASTVLTTAKAGFWIRVVASLIDSFIVGIVQLVLGLALGLAAGMGGSLGPEGEAAVGLVSSLFGTVLGLAYYIFFTGYCGQTPGKMALRIKVVRTDGGEISYGRAFLREVIGKFASAIILGIGYLMVAFDKQKQGLHDKIADTYVIKL